MRMFDKTAGPTLLLGLIFSYRIGCRVSGWAGSGWVDVANGFTLAYLCFVKASLFAHTHLFTFIVFYDVLIRSTSNLHSGSNVYVDKVGGCHHSLVGTLNPLSASP